MFLKFKTYHNSDKRNVDENYVYLTVNFYKLATTFCFFSALDRNEWHTGGNYLDNIFCQL